MYLHLSAVGETPGLGVLVCKAWGVTMLNQEKGAWLPVVNNLQIQFYINVFGVLYQILHMWLIFNIVKICGAGMFEALSQDKYCMQSAVASLTLAAAIWGNTEIVPPSKLTALLCTQAIVKPFTCNCCWGLRKWLFGETFSPQHVVFWSRHRMRHFLMFLLPWGVREGGQSNLSSHFLLPSGLESWAIWPLSRGMSWATKSKLAVTFKYFFHRLPAAKLYVHFILLLSAYIFPCLSLYKYNGLCREYFSGCYCTEYRQITVSLCCIPNIMPEFFYFGYVIFLNLEGWVSVLNFYISISGNLLQKHDK